MWNFINMKLVYKRDIEYISSRETSHSLLAEDKIIAEARRYSPSLHSASVFLSHSHLDENIVRPMVVFLRSRGVDVYVDWMDNTMSKETSGETAAKLKEKIKMNDKFLFLATENSIKSKWCNWEIGYGDAEKYIDKIAVFPLLDNNGIWNGQEYLEIYPSIQKKDNTDDFVLVYPNGTTISLNDWLLK